MKTDCLYLAAMVIGTHALGPGYRAAIWVQGCPFHCIGCISPEWIPTGYATTDIDDIALQILEDPKIDGLTISGGEPMMQAKALYHLVKMIKTFRNEVNIICFTGYQLKNLVEKPPSPYVTDFIKVIDILIDGLYVESKNDNKGLRGSSNQKVHFLSNKFQNYNFTNIPRKIEIEVRDGHAFIVGIPPKNFEPAWDQAMLNILR